MKNTSIRRYITVKTQFDALHRYKDAPLEVAFLRNYHRHLFKVSLSLEVKGDEREIEFFMLRRALNGFIGTILLDAEQEDNLPVIESCEKISGEIASYFYKKYNRCCRCQVSEDGENSASSVIE